MGLPSDLRGLLRAEPARRRLALEAFGELIRARLDTARKAAHYTRHFGALGREAEAATPEQEALAAEIGQMVARVARRMPFRAKCLQQVLAVRRMLTRRGVPSTVYLALANDPSRRAATSRADPAHAWIKAGSRIVNGDTGLDGYTVVGAFS